MAGLSRKDQLRVLDHVQQQGVSVTETKSGYLMRMPDGGTAMLHKTSSDRMMGAALRAKLRRHGITWPFDGADAVLPEYITAGTMRKSTLENFRKAILGDDLTELPDEVFPQEVLKAEHEVRAPGTPLPKAANFTAGYRALYRLGYVPGGRYEKTRGRAWVLRPEEVVEEPVKAAAPFAPERMFAPAPVEEEPTLVVDVSVTDVPSAPADREFIDTHDSWCLNLNRITDLTVDQLRRTMQASGLEVEIRVWRS